MKPILEQSFSELQAKGATCPADLTYDVLLVELRHSYLSCAKDIISSNDEGEHAFAHLISEVAEILQDAIDRMGSDSCVTDLYQEPPQEQFLPCGV